MISFQEYLWETQMSDASRQIAASVAALGRPLPEVMDAILNSPGQLQNEFFGGLFKRLGSAWKNLWHGKDEPPEAEQKVNQLIKALRQGGMSNQEIEASIFSIILQGLERLHASKRSSEAGTGSTGAAGSGSTGAAGTGAAGSGIEDGMAVRHGGSTGSIPADATPEQAWEIARKITGSGKYGPLETWYNGLQDTVRNELHKKLGITSPTWRARDGQQLAGYMNRPGIF